MRMLRSIEIENPMVLDRCWPHEAESQRQAERAAQGEAIENAVEKMTDSLNFIYDTRYKLGEVAVLVSMDEPLKLADAYLKMAEEAIELQMDLIECGKVVVDR